MTATTTAAARAKHLMALGADTIRRYHHACMLEGDGEPTPAQQRCLDTLTAISLRLEGLYHTLLHPTGHAADTVDADTTAAQILDTLEEISLLTTFRHHPLAEPLLTTT